MPLDVTPGATDDTLRYQLLMVGHNKQWWEYESANEPGFVDDGGDVHPGPTYSIKLPDETPVTLPAAWVEGFVYCTALEHDDVEAVRHRPGM